jgi:hypothetical protein
MTMEIDPFMGVIIQFAQTSYLSPLTLQKEKILSDREKRVRQIQQALRVVQTQILGHDSGAKTVEEGKLMSLKNRVKKYESEIADFSRHLSDSVSVCVTSCISFKDFAPARSLTVTARW